MSWDWQKRLQSEAPAPLPDDSSFGGLAVEASEQEPADAGETGRAEAPARGVAGMVWRTPGPSDMTGQSLTKGGLPPLLYGQEHKCAFCRGTGQTRGAHQCPVCRGTTKVAFIPPVVRCAFCYGGGRALRRSNATCLACRGSGVIRVRPPIQICTKCKGRGRQTGQSLYCGSCHGSGVVTGSESHELIEHDARLGVDEMVLTREAASRRRTGSTGTTERPEEPRKHQQGLQWQAAPKGTR